MKLWKRGTPLSAARTVFEGKAEDVGSGGRTEILSDGRYDLVTRTPAFFREETFLYVGDRLVKVDLPEDAVRGSSFAVASSSRCAATGPSAARRSARDRCSPGPSTTCCMALSGSTFSSSRARACRSPAWTAPATTFCSRHSTTCAAASRPSPCEDGAWKRAEIPTPGIGTAEITAASDQSESFFFTYQDFTTPESLWLSDNGAAPVQVKSMPTFFDAKGMTTEQFEATSKDGTKIPYFVVRPPG